MSDKEKVVTTNDNTRYAGSNNSSMLDAVKDLVIKESTQNSNDNTTESSAAADITNTEDSNKCSNTPSNEEINSYIESSTTTIPTVTNVIEEEHVNLLTDSNNNNQKQKNKLQLHEILISITGGVVLAGILIINMAVYKQNKAYASNDPTVSALEVTTTIVADIVPTSAIAMEENIEVASTTEITTVATTAAPIMNEYSKFYYSDQRQYLVVNPNVEIDYRYLRLCDLTIGRYQMQLQEERGSAPINIKYGCIVDANEDNFTILYDGRLDRLPIIDVSKVSTFPEEIILESGVSVDNFDVTLANKELEENISNMYNNIPVRYRLDKPSSNISDINYRRMQHATEKWVKEKGFSVDGIIHIFHEESNRNYTDTANDPIVIVAQFGGNYYDIVTVTLGIDSVTVVPNVDSPYITRDLTFRDVAYGTGNYGNFDEYSGVIELARSIADKGQVNTHPSRDVYLLKSYGIYYVILDPNFTTGYFEVRRDLKSASVASNARELADILNRPLN